jgi:hypothetical protein
MGEQLRPATRWDFGVMKTQRLAPAKASKNDPANPPQAKWPEGRFLRI